MLIRQQRGAGGIPVSVQTMRYRIHAAGLKSRVPAKKPIFFYEAQSSLPSVSS